MKFELAIVDYLNGKHAKDMASLLNHYAEDPMGGGKSLSAFVRENLAMELSKLPHAFSVICYVDGEPVGLINCFEAFSTFRCKPLINIHDIIVLHRMRGHGICQRMLILVEEQARSRGCCKITLEVLEGNEKAQKSYLKFGFDGYELDPVMGKALFWQKEI